MDWLGDLYETFFGFQEALSPIYLVAFVVIAGFLYLRRRVGGGFLHYLLPRDIWLHKSTMLDVKLFVIGRLMTFFGVAAKVTAAPAVAIWVMKLIPEPLISPADLSPWAVALIVFVFADFSLYWIHYAYHRVRVIWPLHAVHHSAEVMTPITTHRHHPLAQFVSATMHSVLFGGLFGLTLGTLSPDLTLTEVVGANAFLVLANLTFTNFQHSHIWISFGPVLEHLFISPAQHQVHHSVDPKHYNKNFGQTFAVWDWMFGTLYVIRDKEELTLGLNGKVDAPLTTHRLDLVLIDPIRRMLRP